MNEMPTMLSSSYTSNTIGGDWAAGMIGNNARAGFDPEVMKRMQDMAVGRQNNVVKPEQEQQMASARIVKVFVADTTSEDIPLDKRILYTGPEKLTDATDQELFFDVPIGDLLATHNKLRAETRDKKASEKFGKDIFLEAARIRDLKMVVVTVASF